MTLSEWTKREDYIELWKKTWKEPHMRAGLSVMIHLGLPQASILSPTSATNESINVRALAHSRTEGWYAALKTVDFLKNPKAEQSELPSPWEEATLT